MNEKILQELEDLSPELAGLKKQHHQIDMPNGYQKELFAKIKSELPGKPKAKLINLSILGAVAASCLVLIAYLSLIDVTTQIDSQNDVFETYVLDNLDEYEDILIMDEEDNSSLSKKLVDIPESELISYLENNLDQLDLELQY